jgi:hypothetical protein
MFDSITFYNHFHNGDIHVSRSFIDYIANNCNYKINISHNNHPEVYKNDKISFNNSISKISSLKLPPKIIDNTLYVNTWYAAQDHKFMNRHGITFDTLFDLFNEFTEEHLNFSLPNNPKILFPSINYNLYNTSNIDNFCSSTESKIVLVCNGHALSGQAENFDLNELTFNLASKYHGVIFILTNKIGTLFKRENIFYSEDIINKGYCDLNENAYLSEKSCLIVGRASGVQSFAITRNNLFDRVDAPTFISFSSLGYKPDCFWLGNKFSNIVSYQSKMIESQITDPILAQNLVEKCLLEKINGKL